MNQQHKKDIIAGLKGGLEFLSPTFNDEYGKYEYFCWAMEEAECRGTINSTERSEAAGYISKLLGVHSTIRSWLLAMGFEDSVDKDRRHNRGRCMQAHRRAWVAHMIKELSQ
jgi:hypothetical protein